MTCWCGSPSTNCTAGLVAAGRDAASRYPGIAAHLAACGPCGEDFRGLLAAVTEL